MAVMQTVILFGSKTWVPTPRLEKSFEGFHRRAVQRMKVMDPKLQQNGTWVYIPIGEDLATVGMEDIGVYIAR